MINLFYKFYPNKTVTISISINIALPITGLTIKLIVKSIKSTQYKGICNCLAKKKANKRAKR